MSFNKREMFKMRKISNLINVAGGKVIKLGNRRVEKSTLLGIYEPPIPEKLKQLRAEKDEKIR